MRVLANRCIGNCRRRLLAALTAEMVLLFSAPAATAGMFMGLGTDPSSSGGSFASAVSADGSAVVGNINVGGVWEGVRWTSNTGVERLGRLANGDSTGAYAVSGNGSVVVGDGGGLPLEWTQATGWVALAGNPSPGGALGISADGTSVVGYVNHFGGATSAFGPSGILGPGLADGVSGDGSIIVGLTTGAADNQAFRWTQATGMAALGNGGANAISQDGSTIVGYERPTGNSSLAFRWTASTGMVSLGVLPFNDRSEAYAVSGDGSVIVGRSFASNGPLDLQAFIWDQTHGLRNLEDVLIGDGLNLTGWQLTEATGISADGLTITGNGIDTKGKSEAWVARLDAPVPEPPALALWLCAGVGALSCRTMRRLSSARPSAVDSVQAG